MQVIDSIEGLRKARKAITGRVGVVPTMGALHEGHLTLARQARADNDTVIATIFVNPTQFAPNEDFNAYPRDLARDLAMLETLGVDVVFTPTPALMYPPNFQTFVKVDQVTQGLEGDLRPNHFRGVATVVSKLFNLTQPDVAYFGQKDAQQVVVIRRMVADLNFPLEVAVIPTVREADGLAMSSRNVYLTPEQRAAAGVIYRALVAAAQAYDEGERTPANLRAVARNVLKTEAQAEIEYVAVNDPSTLIGVHEPAEQPLLLSMAVQIGRPRLLDNCLLPWSLNNRDGLTATLGV
ncbi:MAG: pantoate--beta-alanine ligase [Chloroflexi bacterium]|nr:pantoate--beta-alanine ligase [Chloroflexota bacterium]